MESATGQPDPAERDAVVGDPKFLADVTASACQAAVADDAWIACVVLLERLQSPALVPAEVTMLLADLAARYEQFRETLRPIERLIAYGCSAQA